MNSDETWLLYLFSGTFASAVGGGVAMLVLWRTNAHQAKLSEKQLAVQRMEAKRSRSAAAVGDLVAAMEQLLDAAETSEYELNARIFAALSALTRLGLEDLSGEMLVSLRGSIQEAKGIALEITRQSDFGRYDERVHRDLKVRRAALSETSEFFVALAPLLLRQVMDEWKPDDGVKLVEIMNRPTMS